MASPLTQSIVPGRISCLLRSWVLISLHPSSPDSGSDDDAQGLGHTHSRRLLWESDPLDLLLTT